MGEHQGHEEQGGGEGGKPRSPGAETARNTAEIQRAWEPQSSTDSSFRKLPLAAGGRRVDGWERKEPPASGAWCVGAGSRDWGGERGGF